MRIRFVPTDYSAAGAAGGFPLETLDFVRLPLPDLPPLDCPSFSANFLQTFGEIPIFGESGEIEKLPIDDALSMFLSDVLPHFVDGFCFEESRVDRSDVPLEEKGGTAPSNRDGTFVQFEILEMDIPMLPLKSAAHSQIECLDIFSEIPDAEFTMDLLDSELMLHDHSDIQESVYSVDEMSVEYIMEQKADLLEDADLHCHDISFPLFEVDVESLGVLGRTDMMDELLSFENIGKQQVAGPHEVNSNNKELLGTMELDSIKYLLHHSVAIECLQGTNFSSELDYLSIIELPLHQIYSTLHHVKPDGYSIWSMDQILFDEFLFFDLDSYHFCDVFSDSAKGIEAETCESMFAEAMEFRSFSQLIVCQELTLMDNSFKSLPAPIISDHGNTRSLHSSIEELLSQLDWHSSSASDGLYLDWHFLGEDGCVSVKYSSCWKMLSEIDTYNVDYAMNSSDSAKPIFDFILSEAYSNKQNAESYKETLNLSCSDVSIIRSSSKADLSSLSNNLDAKRINEDTLLKTGVEKVPLFGESMSSDLEFFLNPHNNIRRRESAPVDKSVDTNTLGQVLTSRDDSALANTTSGVHQKWNVKMHQKRDLDSASGQKDSKTKLEELLDAIPVKETYDNEPMTAVNEDENCTVMAAQSMPVNPESEQHLSCKPFGHDIVIIVNTRNFCEEMVMSRRSTYQKILEMEQDGAQVVERDIDLPIDVIVSSAVCLSWYDCRNIGKKASAPDEAFSCLPLCVDSIAESTLTSLSFAFSCCILIFEGECNFLCSIMESSDELYAAAASLGIDIQLFFSYSSSMTEEIILSCINVAAKLSRGLYPKMSDSESLAELFLTAFPSINPLSAHAILCSDAILGEFLELSNVGRISSLQKYQVPVESIALLSAISRYGEREDSRSGITDCSSSISVPDSENVQLKSVSEIKKAKYRHEPYNAGDTSNDLFCTESLKLLPDDQLNLPKLSVSCNSSLSGNTEISNKSKQFSLSFNDKFFCNSQKIDADMMKKSAVKSSLYDFPLRNALQASDETDELWMPQIEIEHSPRWRSGMTGENHFSRKRAKVTGAPEDNFTGEVLDVEDVPAFKENFPAVNPSCFSQFLLDAEQDHAARNSRVGKRPFGATTLPMQTNPTDINSASGSWVSRSYKRQTLREEIGLQFDTINRSDGSVEEDVIEKAPQNSYKLTFQEQGPLRFGQTPLSSALHSTQMQQGSPWTMEFLNRIREKSRLRKQSVSNESSYSSPHFSSPGNTSNFSKRSPSIFELYKYRGGSTPQRTTEQKGLKRSLQPQNSVNNKKASASCPPSWTPVDKRARGTLSFSSNGSGGQSKLVWRNNNYHAAKRRL